MDPSRVAAWASGSTQQHSASTFGPHVGHPSRLGQHEGGGGSGEEGSPKVQPAFEQLCRPIREYTVERALSWALMSKLK